MFFYYLLQFPFFICPFFPCMPCCDNTINNQHTASPVLPRLLLCLLCLHMLSVWPLVPFDHDITHCLTSLAPLLLHFQQAERSQHFHWAAGAAGWSSGLPFPLTCSTSRLPSHGIGARPSLLSARFCLLRDFAASALETGAVRV